MNAKDLINYFGEYLTDRELGVLIKYNRSKSGIDKEVNKAMVPELEAFIAKASMEKATDISDEFGKIYEAEHYSDEDQEKFIISFMLKLLKSGMETMSLVEQAPGYNEFKGKLDEIHKEYGIDYDELTSVNKKALSIIADEEKFEELMRKMSEDKGGL